MIPTQDKPQQPASHKAKPGKPIFLCADDFGMSTPINAGILALAEQGRLSATSCMPRGQCFQRDAAQIRALPLQKGLHLNFSEDLDGQAFFQPLPELIRNSYLRRLDRKVISAEIEYQLDVFENTLDMAPDYVDGHQHVHQFPIVRDCLLEILQRRYAQRLPWLRSTRRPPQPGIPLGLQIKAGIIDFLGAAAFNAQAKKMGFASNANLLGVYGFDGGEAGYASLLERWIALTGANDLIMCHPARGADPQDPLSAQREAEFAVLSGPLLQNILDQQHASISTRRPI
jgi:predicted glycoside hydrolase/deacetylase ChbG (UPF0249 family)